MRKKNTDKLGDVGRIFRGLTCEVIFDMVTDEKIFLEFPENLKKNQKKSVQIERV